MAKYDPLREYLKRQSGARATLRFAEVEEVLGTTLPASAMRHRAWWANDTHGGHPQAGAWLEEGWIVEDANLTAQMVTLVRVVPG